MKTSLKSLTIIGAAIVALFLTRIGLSYLLILIALGLILPFITEDKKSAIISGVLYAAISYILSYPSGLFLINYMPTIDIPVNVSFIEVFFNLLIGLLVPIIIAIIICSISSIIGKYLSKLVKQNNNEKQDKGYHFESKKQYKNEYDDYENNYEKHTPKTKKKLMELSPIQKAKNRRKYEEE